MTDHANELRRLTQAVSGWSNCNQAWLDQSEDIPAAVVGHIDEDGNTYPIATIDCDQYYAAHQSLLLAKFYAAANPEAITELLDRLEAAEKDITIKEEVIDSLAVVVKRLDAQCDAAEAEAIEQSRLNGMGSEREAALLAKLEAAEKSDAESLAMYRKARDERDDLRAKIAQMERQEPIGWFARLDGDGPLMECKHADLPRVPLYARVGAQAANMRLIAAAPDLLRYLKEARRTLEMWKDVAPAVSLCADIDAVIARATGEQP